MNGSTTRPEKIDQLKSSGIIPFQLKCTDHAIESDHVVDFFRSDKLFVNLPFRRELKDPFEYVHQMRTVFSYAKTAGVKKIVMASSTAVYPLINKVIKENEEFVPDTDRSKALREAECVFLNQSEVCASVVRLAGLYGPGREIGSFLKSERMANKEGEAPVNLIHLDDCIGIIMAIFEGSYCSEIFNACGDAHPLRKDLYAHVAVAMKVKQPVFQENENPRYKIISNDKVKNLLGYRFIHPSPWKWIEQNQVVRGNDGLQKDG